MSSPHITQETADEFAIGALDEAAAEAVVSHIAVCPPCAQVVADSERVAATLLLGIPRTPPPPRLRNRVFRAAGLNRPAPVVWTTRFVTAGAGIAAVIIAVASFTGMVSLRSQVKDLNAENARLQSSIDEALTQKVQIAALTRQLDDQAREAGDLRWAARVDRDLMLALLSPDSRIAEVYSVDPSTFAIGRLIWDPDQKRVWFVASRLPRLEGNQSYQLWVDAQGRYVSLGTFNADESGFARFQALVPQGVEGYDSAVVTLESGPVDARNGPAIFVADLSVIRR